MVFMAGEGAGRSGSFFFFSHDSKYIIKTMTKCEVEIYLKMLPMYLNHLRTNRKSLLAPILGVFTIKTPHIGKLHFMIMENTLQIRDPDNL